ncbi:rhodanese-like domain-containing protein [Cetobacterium sp. SF1]|uniref:rhodanese-like domain-containing protein n=1 Tax=unclassified Cetobacterium TaxID=2630983 RepID=UPI003CF0A884
MEKFETLEKSKVKELIKDKNIHILDVRGEDEYEDGHLEGAINIPLPELPSRLDELDKNETYLCICAHGVRSKSAAKILTDENFKKVYNSQEGMATWKD